MARNLWACPHTASWSRHRAGARGRGVFGDLTVRENLTLGAYSARARNDEAANLDRVHALFPQAGERSGQVVRTMSGGEQQMVAIGRQ
jgi:branched-chain amino acid transport system ATP-binding protein